MKENCTELVVLLMLSVAGLTGCSAGNPPLPEIKGTYDQASHVYTSPKKTFSIYFPASPPGDSRYPGAHTHLWAPEPSYVYYDSADINYAIAMEEGYKVVGTWTPVLAGERLDNQIGLVVKELHGKEAGVRIPVNLLGGLFMGKESYGTLPDGRAFRVRQYVRTQPDYNGFVLMAVGKAAKVNSSETDLFFTSLKSR